MSQSLRLATTEGQAAWGDEHVEGDPEGVKTPGLKASEGSKKGEKSDEYKPSPRASLLSGYLRDEMVVTTLLCCCFSTRDAACSRIDGPESSRMREAEPGL